MSVWLSVCRDTETGLFSLFSCQDHLLKADRSPRSLSTVISLERTGPASYFWAGVDGAPYRSTSIPAARRDTASLETLLLTVCRFFSLTSRESPRAQPWGPSPRFWSSSPASDLLEVNPRRPVRVDSLCWRASVSSVTPPAPSATGTSCLNALPVELVSTITYVRTEIVGGCSKGGEKRLNVLLFVTPRCTRFKLRWVQTNVLRSLISAKTINNSTATTMASWKLNNIPGIVWQISDISQCLLERWKKKITKFSLFWFYLAPQMSD